MAASLGGSDDDVISSINITPFVDIILVVLIIFMVTATQIARSSIQVDLPDAATGEVTETTSLGVTLLASGDLLLDGAPSDGEGLRAAVRAAKAKGSEVTVLVAADKNVQHGRVVWVLDLVRSEGVGKFAINIDKTQMVPPDPAGAGG
jgi:biopolymer transport protein ExbD